MTEFFMAMTGFAIGALLFFWFALLHAFFLMEKSEREQNQDD